MNHCENSFVLFIRSRHTYKAYLSKPYRKSLYVQIGLIFCVQNESTLRDSKLLIFVIHAFV